MKQILILLTILLGVSSAQAQTPPDPNPQVRLARVSAMPNALLLTIKLADGWHTYWQHPGDAGIAPQFQFTGAHGVDVMFPVPSRFDENGLATYGYDGEVTLPIVTGAQNLADISLHLSFAACAEICVPLEAHVSTRQHPLATAGRFRDAMRSVPRPTKGGAAQVTSNGIALDVSPYKGRFLIVLPYGMIAEGHVGEDGKARLPFHEGVTQAELARHVADIVIDDPSGPVKLTIPLQQ